MALIVLAFWEGELAPFELVAVKPLVWINPILFRSEPPRFLKTFVRRSGLPIFDFLRVAHAIYSNRVHPNEWQPIETAPKDGTRIILFHPERLEDLQIVIGKWDAGYELWDNGGGVFSCGMTHWQPLPLSPHHLAKKINRLFSARSSAS